MSRYLLLALFLLSCASSTSMVPVNNTREEVASYVNRAAAIVARSGPSCDTFSQPAWRSGDWYIFVTGFDRRIVCHATPSMIGRDDSQIVDANGNRVGDMLFAAANSPVGHGWAEYVWPRPGQTTPVPKSSYVVRVTAPDGKQYYVGSGGYDLK